MSEGALITLNPYISVATVKLKWCCMCFWLTGTRCCCCHDNHLFFFFFLIPTCCPAPAESWIVSLLLSCLCVCPRVSMCLTCQCCLSLVPLYPSTRCLAGFTGHRCEQAVLKTVSDPKRMWTRLNSTTHVIAGVSPFSQKIHVFPRHGDETWAVAPGALGPVCRL